MKLPTLVIHGSIDPLVPPDCGKDVAATVPGAKLLMIPNMGHAIPIPDLAGDHRRDHGACEGGDNNLNRHPERKAPGHVPDAIARAAMKPDTPWAINSRLTAIKMMVMTTLNLRTSMEAHQADAQPARPPWPAEQR